MEFIVQTYCDYGNCSIPSWLSVSPVAASLVWSLSQRHLQKLSGTPLQSDLSNLGGNLDIVTSVKKLTLIHQRHQIFAGDPPWRAATASGFRHVEPSSQVHVGSEELVLRVGLSQTVKVLE